jgi:ribosomal protein S18 acetylase RimI-like enzyme
MDKSQNQLMSLEVIFIGGERLNHDGSVVLLESLLKRARDLKYKSLEIFWTEGHPLAQSYLELQNFEVLSKTVEIYGTSEQGERVIEQLAPPSDFKFVWQDFKEEQFESFFAMYREIFINNPQYSFKDPQEFKRSLLQGVPPLRVLMDGKIIVGFVLVGMKNKVDGRIYSMGRNPSYKGISLGARLLHECIRTLNAYGATSYSGFVAIENAKALAVYENFTQVRRAYSSYSKKV